ncbi:antibiotic biosynthesis monooxygenase family protein [Saccharothrix australiensis]|uniref:Antibiotic biosynthesis monooxygenase n=1 Tax=Saccharothrix australiensis TaxID=2072 RepID=A0A495VW83_9PSEU|nr:antibiotic biosynthesis monooxygenase family protein [Saccharothrix australiensis]RKT53180.1 antibiotic biosynthesis monooxygenase [Saccharothrix australiensis]
MLLVCRFTVPESAAEPFTARATRALELLTAQPGCRRGALGRSTDEADLFVLTVEFDSVVAYRRALSPFEVREHVVPLLSEASAEPSAYEPLLVAGDGSVERLTSLVARDAGTVRLGEAAGPATPR